MLSLVRSLGRPGTVTGAPVAWASAMKRAAESGLTPRRSSVAGSALASDVRPWSRQRPCKAPNANSRFGMIGPPIPPPI